MKKFFEKVLLNLKLWLVWTFLFIIFHYALFAILPYYGLTVNAFIDLLTTLLAYLLACYIDMKLEDMMSGKQEKGSEETKQEESKNKTEEDANKKLLDKLKQIEKDIEEENKQ